VPTIQAELKPGEPVELRSTGTGAETGKAALPRLGSIDAYRGLVMLLMMAEVLDFCQVSANIPASGFWQFLCHQQSHVAWVGASLHDLIQPSFSFLVGVALPFSIARRKSAGQPQSYRTLHAFGRALILVLLGVFLRSLGHRQTYWTFEDTLTQIGLGYGFLYLLAARSTRVKWIVFIVVLVGYWLAFALYPLPGRDFNWVAAGVSPDAANQLTGFPAHWNKNTNFAWAFDVWFLNLFPVEHPFAHNEGGYCTLSFIPTFCTMILGLLAGGVIRGERTPWGRVKWLAIAGVIGLAAGTTLGWLGICPVVKRIWTPSWTLFSGGWCLLFLAGFYAVMDIQGRKRWAFPLVVIGMNSIAAYCTAHLFEGFIVKNLTTHLGTNLFTLPGEAYESLVRGTFVLLILWAILFWLYRRKIFLRV
jgi:heparan-alpha-glucosaminide N-acetyltransferase